MILSGHERAEERLRKTERRLNAVLDNASVAVFLMDDRQHCTYMNAAAERLTGYTLAETQGRPLHDVIHHTRPDGSPFPCDECPIHRAFPESSNTRGEDVFVHKDRHFYPVAFTASPVRDEASRTIGTIVEVRDISTEKAAEAALRESEDHYRHAVELNPQVVWTARPDGQLDRVAHRWFDWTGTAGLGASWAEAMHPDDLGPSLEAWTRSVTTGTPYNIEHRARMQGGAYHWMHSRALPRRDAEGRIVKWHGTTEDIHDRRMVEAELRESRDRLAQESRALEVLNRTGALIASELDLGRIVQAVTDAGVELTGAQFGAFFYNVLNEQGGSYTLYTLSGVDRSAFERFPMPRATAVFGPTFRGERPVRSDDITADPRYGRSDPHRGMPKGHLPVCSYLAAPVVSRSGEVLGGLFFGHPAPAVFTEAAERVVVGLAGQAASAIDNVRLFEAAQRANETLEARVAGRTAELRQAIAALHEEVLEREQAEEALRQSQKMEAVGQLTGGIAHDFNNMLQGIKGALEVARHRVRQGRAEEAGRLMDAAQQGVTRAAALTHRLLAFARRQPLDPRPVKPDALVGGMEELIRRTAGPGITVEFRLRDGVWFVLCDPNQLENALLNLAINARDAMPDGGKLTVGTADARLAQAEIVGQDGAEPGDYVEITVSDTGTGMDETTQARAFEPFFTTKPIGHGTGLGLSQLYGFVRQSGGFVRLDSAPGRGTTVHIYLPRHEPVRAEEGHAAPEAEPEKAGTGEVVLLVEDEAAVRAVAAERLRELGYAVLEAGEGPAALRLLRKGGRVDVLVTDVGLPGGMNGRQVADAAREHRPDLPVLFITGYAGSALESRLAPGMEVIGKPFALDTLAARVQTMLKTTSAT